MKKRYDLLPMSFCDLAGIETWLGDRAARGLHLVSMKNVVVFEKGVPRRAVYRVEPQPPKTSLTQERKEMYADFGWEYVCSLKEMFVIWRSYDDEPAELHTDPQVEAELLEPLYQKRRWLVPVGVFGVVLLLASVVMMGYGIFGHPNPLLYMVKYGSNFSMVAVVVVELILFAQVARDLRGIGQLTEVMKNGQPRPHHKKLGWCAQYLQKAVLVAMLIIAVFVWVSLILTFTGKDRFPLGAYAGPLPSLTLAEVENDPGLVIDYAPYDYEGLEDRYPSEIFIERTEFCSVYVEVTEDGEVPGKTWEDSEKTYSPSLRTTYFQLRFGFLAKPLLEEMLDDKIEWYRHGTITVTELWDTAFDQAFLLGDADAPDLLLARLGNRVIEVNYSGYASLEGHVDTIAENMANFKPLP